MTAEQKKILPFVVASFVMFISLNFSMKIAGVGLLLWVLTFAWTINKIMLANYKINDFIQANNKILDESIKNKKYLKSSINLVALPMVLIGLGWVLITIVLMMFVF